MNKIILLAVAGLSLAGVGSAESSASHGDLARHGQAATYGHECPFCHSRFVTLNQLGWHIGRLHQAPGFERRIQRTSGSLRQCSQCHRRDCRCTLRAVHQAATMPSCGICGASFTSLGGLSDHFRDAHGSPPPPTPGGRPVNRG